MTGEVSSLDRTKSLQPLEVKCTRSDCENGLHCFRQTVGMRNRGMKGPCRSCGASLVCWERIETLNLEEVDYIFESLQHEWIGHHFWHKEIDLKAVNHARRKGRVKLRTAIIKRIEKSVASPNNPHDGRQTPFDGNAIYYGQHAVAACWRRCIEEWYGIPRDREITIDEIHFLSELVRRYVDIRLPELTEDGESIPPIRLSLTQQ